MDDIITAHELAEVERANKDGRQPVVFIHGLWLLPSSWDRWAELFEAAGYVALKPGWPDDPETVEEANARPELFAKKTIGQVAEHFEHIARALTKKPAVIGHSFGGLLAQILAGRGASAATVAISPAPFQGVLPLPFSALKSAFPVLGNPANRDRAVPLTLEQFHYAFANAVDETEAQALYKQFAVPAAGAPLFQAALANFNPHAATRVDFHNDDRAPLLLIAGEVDHTAPVAVTRREYKLESKSKAITAYKEFVGRSHYIVGQPGWEEVADFALDWALDPKPVDEGLSSASVDERGVDTT